MELARYPAAEEVLRELVSRSVEELGVKHGATNAVVIRLVEALEGQDNLHEALLLTIELFGPVDPRVLRIRARLAAYEEDVQHASYMHANRVDVAV